MLQSILFMYVQPILQSSIKFAWGAAFLPVSSPVLWWELCGNWKLALKWPQTLAM